MLSIYGTWKLTLSSAHIRTLSPVHLRKSTLSPAHLRKSTLSPVHLRNCKLDMGLPRLAELLKAYLFPWWLIPIAFASENPHHPLPQALTIKTVRNFLASLPQLIPLQPGHNRTVSILYCV